MDELADQLRRLMADPALRQAVATAGRTRYHALFNETLVARYVVEVMLGVCDPGDYAWPTLAM